MCACAYMSNLLIYFLFDYLGKSQEWMHPHYVQIQTIPASIRVDTGIILCFCLVGLLVFVFLTHINFFAVIVYKFVAKEGEGLVWQNLYSPSVVQTPLKGDAEESSL